MGPDDPPAAQLIGGRSKALSERSAKPKLAFENAAFAVFLRPKAVNSSNEIDYPLWELPLIHTRMPLFILIMSPVEFVG